MKTRSLLSACTAVFVLAFAAGQVRAATTSVLTSGLRAPSKIAYSTKGNILVAESGLTPNTGRVSIVDPLTGARRTLLDGLPSGPSIPDGAPSGPSGLAMRGRTLYLTIGLGNAVLNGQAQGTQVPNPTPSSPLFCSVLSIHFSAKAEQTTGGFTLTLADHWTLKNGGKVSLDAGAGEKVVVELVADFPDFLPGPSATEPKNVLQSNPFGIVILDQMLYINDASTNSVRSVDLDTRVSGILTVFAPLQNTLPFGPPVVEAVPDSIHLYNDQLLVTLFGGGPFPPGGSQVSLVNPTTGTNAPFIRGLTSAIDVMPLNGGFLVLEFTANLLKGPLPGRLIWFATPTTSPAVLVDTLISPTSMVRDTKSGAVFVSQIFTGQIIKVTP